MNIENYLSTEQFKSRKQLAAETGMTDRAVRKAISKLKQTKPVIYNSQTKGYKLAKDMKSFNTAEEAQEEWKQVEHCINDIEARKKAFNKAERTYIAYLKKLEEEITVLKNENHIPYI